MVKGVRGLRLVLCLRRVQGGGLGAPERKEKHRASAQTLTAQPYPDTVPPLQRRIGATRIRDCEAQSNEVPKATWISKARGQGSGGGALDSGLLSEPVTSHPEETGDEPVGKRAKLGMEAAAITG